MSDEFTTALVEESPDALIALTAVGEVLFWSRGAETLFGYARDEVLGRRLDDVVVPADRRAESQAALEQAIETGIALLETVRQRRDGSTIHVDVSMRAVRNGAGRLEFIAVNKKDVSGLQGLAEARASEQMFRGLLESAPDAMVILGAAGRIVLINSQAESLFGWRREDMLGQPVELLVPERLRDRHRQHRSSYFFDPRVRAMGAGGDLYGLRRDGTEFPVEISLSPLRTPTGMLVSAAIRDISERRKVEREIVEASRMKSEFLANMSHELRTPLNAIIGFSDLLHKKLVTDPDEMDQCLIDILSSSRHLLQLINDILDLAKVESGKMEFHPEPVDLGPLVSEVHNVVRGLAASKRIQIEAIVDPEVATVVVDPSRLKQVLYNYLSNAIKFTPESGHVRVRALPEGDAAFRLEVEDNGIGIHPEAIERLFVEFQQLDTGAAKKHQGTGLGLALTKRIVEAHGGRVEVRSRPGEGSVFAAVLPREVRHGG